MVYEKMVYEKTRESMDVSGNRIYDNNSSSLMNGLKNIFTKSNVILVLMFLGIYFATYFGLGIFFNKSTDPTNFELKLSRTLDIIFLVVLILVIVSIFFSYNDAQKNNLFIGGYNSFVSYINQPYSIFTTLIVLGVFYLIVYLFRVPVSNQTKPIFVSFIENLLWILFVIILFVDFFKYVLNVSFGNLFSTIQIVPTVPTNPVLSSKVLKTVSATDISGNVNEVFNISNNIYTYDDAQAICTSYGAKLATYDQIEQSYNNGAEWCNYGWSAGQMIFFPTQKSTWQTLQKSDKHKNDCGRPGINGGYIDNPYVQFGVNCYGKKPKASQADLDRMKNKKVETVEPQTPEDMALQAKVNFWKQNADKLLQLNSYNTKKWSEWN
jgi:hypothetical protein